MTRSPRCAPVVFALVAAVLAACATPAAVPAGPPADGVFPVTIGHRYGETVVAAAPKRIVVLDSADLDVVLALGIVPVGLTGSEPWARIPAGGVPPSGARPVVVSSSVPGVADVPVDVLSPDLILNVSGPMYPDRYAYFRGVAPTIAGPPGAEETRTPWPDATRTIGRAVGRPVEAERLVAGVDARFAAVRARYPQLVGRSAQCVQSSGYGDGEFTVSGPGGGCADFLAGLGMHSVPALDREYEAGRHQVRWSIPPTAFSGAGRPDVVLLTGIGPDPSRYGGTPLPAGLRVATLTDEEDHAVASPSVLAVPAVLDAVAAKLARALG